jgi:hypothetical protein
MGMSAKMDPQDLIASTTAEAARELGLDPCYVSIVVPLVRAPDAPRPQCCGGGCEPCAEVLNRVADRALELLRLAESNPNGDTANASKRVEA